MRVAADEHRLKADPALYDDLASKLSLTQLKEGAALGRVGACLVDWFGLPP